MDIFDEEILRFWNTLALNNVNDECLDLATIAEIENVKIPFLHINHLIANKKDGNRSKDQIDVIELEKIKILRKEMGLD